MTPCKAKTTIAMLIGSVIGILASPSVAASSEPWVIVGTFNSWCAFSQRDELRQADSGDYALRRRFETGTYEFFFQCGSESLGATLLANGEADSAKLSPGHEPLSLWIPGAGEFEIGFDPQAQSWSLNAISIDEPKISATVLGVPVVDRPFAIDLRDSALPTVPNSPVFEISAPNGDVDIRPSETLGAMVMEVTAAAEGPLRLEIATEVSGKRIATTLDVQVDPLFTIEYRVGTAHITTDLHPLQNGLHRFFIPVRPPRGVSFDFMIVRRGEDVLGYAKDFALPKFNYIIEANQGQLRRHNFPDAPPFVLPGRWETFEHMPASRAKDVEVVGDFNNWEHGDQPWAFRLVPRRDGSFFTITELPAGHHEYMFLLDDREWVNDSAPLRTEYSSDELPRSSVNVGLSSEDVPSPQADAILQEAIQHNPVLHRDRTPLCDEIGLFDLSLSAAPGDLKQAFVVQVAPGHEDNPLGAGVEMSARTDGLGFDRFEARVTRATPEAHYRLVFADGSAKSSFVSQPFEGARGGDRPAWALGAMVCEIDFAGASSNEAVGLSSLLSKLASLKESGCTAILLRNVFTTAGPSTEDSQPLWHVSQSLVPEGTALSESLDPTIWTVADGFFVGRFLAACRALDIRVVINVPISEIDQDAEMFTSVRTLGAESPFVSMFRADFNQEGQLLSWAAADRASGSRPRFALSALGWPAGRAGSRIARSMALWLDPDGDPATDDGVDGWCIEGAEFLSSSYLYELKKLIRRLRSDAIMILDRDDWTLSAKRVERADAGIQESLVGLVAEWLSSVSTVTSSELVRRLESTQRRGPHYELARWNHSDHALDSEISRLLAPFLATYPGTVLLPVDAWTKSDDPSHSAAAQWLGVRQLPELGRVLRLGSVRHIDISDPDVLAYERQLDGIRIVIAINRNSAARDVSRLFPSSAGASLEIPARSAGMWRLPG